MKSLPDQVARKKTLGHCLIHGMEALPRAVASLIAQSRRADLGKAVA